MTSRTLNWFKEWLARGSREHPYLLLGAIAIAAHVALTLWRLRGAYFFADDFLFLELARASKLNTEFLLRDWFGHVEPFALLGHWLFIRLFGLNFDAFVAIAITASASTVGLVAAVAARARAPLSIATACVFAAALSWVTIEPNRWWTNFLLVIPSGLLGMAALWVSAKPAPRLSWSERILLGVLLVAACAFYNKAVFFIALCVAARFFIICSLGASTKTSAGAWSTFLKHALGALADSAVAAIGVALMALLIVSVKWATHAEDTEGTFTATATGAAIGLQFGWLSGVTGLRVTAETPLMAAVLSAVLIDALVLAVIFQSWRANRAAAWLWLALFAMTAISTTLVSAVRSDMFGVWMMAVARYHTETVFFTFAVIAMAFGRSYLPMAAPAFGGEARQKWITVAIGGLVALCQIVGGVRYPPVWDTVGNRQFVETMQFETDAAPPEAALAERQMPERIVPRWMQPYNDLSKFVTTLRQPLRIVSWDAATHYMDDNGVLHAFAELPTQTFAGADGAPLVLMMVSPIESVGFIQANPADQATGWFNPLLAPPEKVRIAIVSNGRIIAWADRSDRPDVGAAYNRGTMNASGFVAPLPAGLTTDSVSAVAVIDGRIGIVLPRA